MKRTPNKHWLLNKKKIKDFACPAVKPLLPLPERRVKVCHDSLTKKRGYLLVFSGVLFGYTYSG
jgi:hypothetical protein